MQSSKMAPSQLTNITFCLLLDAFRSSKCGRTPSAAENENERYCKTSRVALALLSQLSSTAPYISAL